MADIKHPYICTSNFCAAGRRADPGVCVAWSVPLRLLRDRCSMHDATRNMGRVIPRACEMFCVRASCRCHAPIQMRTPHVQNRGDTISLVSCCVLLHAPSSRGAAKREEIDVPKYSSTVDCPVQDHSSLESDRSKRRRLLPADLCRSHIGKAHAPCPQQFFSLLLRCSCALPCQEDAEMGVCVYRSRGRLNAYKASLHPSSGGAVVWDMKSYTIERLRMVSRHTLSSLLAHSPALNDETRYAIRARSHQYAKNSSATYAFCGSPRHTHSAQVACPKAKVRNTIGCTSLLP